MEKSTKRFWYRCLGILMIASGVNMVPWGIKRFNESTSVSNLDQIRAQLAILTAFVGFAFLVVGANLVKKKRPRREIESQPNLESARSDSSEEKSECILFGNELTTQKILDANQQLSLEAIVLRLRLMLVERIGHLWNIDALPDIVKLYESGQKSGQVPFIFGCFYWRILEDDEGMKMLYDDSARVASGWGRAYEITPTETRLTAEGLD